MKIKSNSATLALMSGLVGAVQTTTGTITGSIRRASTPDATVSTSGSVGLPIWTLNLGPRLRCSLAFLLAMLVPLNPIHAQTDLAGITGNVTESSGATLSNGKVEIKNLQTSAGARR